MTRTFAAIWPVTNAGLALPALVLLAEEDLGDMLEEQDVLMCGEPVWTLTGTRLTCLAPVRERHPWDVPAERAAKAYLLDVMPEAA